MPLFFYLTNFRHLEQNIFGGNEDTIIAFWDFLPFKDDCEDFEKNDEQCENIYHGRLQATEMTADLYKVGIGEFSKSSVFWS